MRRTVSMIVLLSSLLFVTGCSSSSDDSDNHVEMKTAIQMKAEDSGYSKAKWPFWDEDWHFKKLSDGNYTAHGTFKMDGEEHEFSAEVEGDSGMVLDFYAD